ncbi:MAG: SGNH/GDSL hydrolase family protein [Phycisphaerales bacterium]|nr:SGNH/GDSL hydrolase family protein [Phycisphaerales bacterium]
MHERQHATAMAAILGLGSCALAQPAFDIPFDLAGRMLSGQGVRVTMLGDSICAPAKGTFYSDRTDRTHFPPHNGVHNVWAPSHGWRGVAVNPVGTSDPTGGYSCWRGVGAFARYQDEGESFAPRVNVSQYADGAVGWTVDTVGHWALTSASVPWQSRMTSYLRTPRVLVGENNHWSEASAQIGRGDLRVRQVLYTSPGILTPEAITFTRLGGTEVQRAFPAAGAGPRWDWVEYPATAPGSTWDPETQAFETTSRFNYQYSWGAETRHFYTGGTLFFDEASDGMIVLSLAHGGYNNIDHLRTPATYGQPGFYFARPHGYADEALLSWLDAFDMTGADRVPVVVIALGTNIAMPDNGGPPESINGLSTEAYADNIRAIIARWRGVYAQRGHDPYFILMGMYDFEGTYPNPFVDSMAERLWEVRSTDPRPERIGFVSLPALMGYVGMGFDPAWYYKSYDHHLSSLGSVRVAEVLWEAFEASVCVADYNRDGVLSGDDFFAYLGDFAAGDARADLTTFAMPGQAGYGVPNGVLNAEDFFFYLGLYAAGCE